MSRRTALATAAEFSLDACAGRLLDAYDSFQKGNPGLPELNENPLLQTGRLLETEWHLWSTRIGAAVKAVSANL